MDKELLPILLGGGYVPEALLLFDRFTVPPTDQRKRLINTLVKALKDGGVWGNLDALYLPAAANAQAALLNWKSALFPLSPQASPTFTADQGYAGDGVASYLATGFTPSSAAGNFVQDSAHFGVWSRSNIGSTTQIPIGARTTSTTLQALINPRTGTNTATLRVNQNTAGAAPASVDSIGHWIANRSAAAVDTLFRNGALFAADTAVSTGLPTSPFVIGALNTGGVISSFATHEIAAASIGASLTDAQIAIFYAALLAYLQGVGAA